MLVVATLHGVLMAAVTLGVRAVVLLFGAVFGTEETAGLDAPALYVAPVHTHAQSTVVLFSAVAPVFVRMTTCHTEPASVFGQLQLCYFVVVVLTTALFVDTVLFFVI